MVWRVAGTVGRDSFVQVVDENNKTVILAYDSEVAQQVVDLYNRHVHGSEGVSWTKETSQQP